MTTRLMQVLENATQGESVEFTIQSVGNPMTHVQFGGDGTFTSLRLRSRPRGTSVAWATVAELTSPGVESTTKMQGVDGLDFEVLVSAAGGSDVNAWIMGLPVKL